MLPEQEAVALSSGATTCIEALPVVPLPPTAGELAALRAERALLGELLAAPPAALAHFMGTALVAQRRLRALLARRTRDAQSFHHKIMQLQRLCARLARRGLAVPVPQLAHGFESAARAFGELAESREAGGDDFLPAQALLELALTDIALVAMRTGAQPPTRRRAHRTEVHRAAEPAAVAGGPQLAAGLEQLATRLADEHGKRIELTLLGLERVPLEMIGAVFDVGSQLLRNAVLHGIEMPAGRTAAGKAAAGQVLVEFRVRKDGRGELLVQDDGAGLHPDRMAQPGDGPGRCMRQVGKRVQGLGGQMQIASRRGQYARVHVRLPMPGSDLRAAG